MTARQRVLSFVLAAAAAVGTAHAFTAPEGDALITHFLASKKTPDLDPSETGRRWST